MGLVWDDNRFSHYDIRAEGAVPSSITISENGPSGLDRYRYVNPVPTSPLADDLAIAPSTLIPVLLNTNHTLQLE